MKTASSSPVSERPGFARRLVPFVARLLIAALFLPAGLSKIPGFAATTAEIAARGLPLPQLGTAIAIAIEVGAGLCLLLGWRTRLAAHLLVAFTVVATLLFHGFWAVPDAQRTAEIVAFSQNLGLIGGLLLLGLTGGGRFAVDRD